MGLTDKLTQLTAKRRTKREQAYIEDWDDAVRRTGKPPTSLPAHEEPTREFKNLGDTPRSAGDRERTFQLQQNMRDQGLYHGPIDGEPGPKLAEALATWQQRFKRQATVQGAYSEDIPFGRVFNEVNLSPRDIGHVAATVYNANSLANTIEEHWRSEK